jgi:PAS domain-containing protein
MSEAGLPSPGAQELAESSDFGGRVRDWLAGLEDHDHGLDPEVLRAELQTAAEELRVADEELVAQQVEVARLLAERGSVTAWHERLVGALPVPILTTDERGVVASANAAAGRLFGRSLVGLVRKPLASFVVVEDRRRLRKLLSDLKQAGGHHLRTTVHVRVRPDQTMAVQIVASNDPATGEHVRWIIVESGTDDREREDPAQLGGHSRISAAGVARAFSELWQMSLHAGDQQEILNSITAICHRAFPDVTWISITLGRPDKPEMVATDSAEAQHLDGLQMQTNQGPVFDTWQLQSPVVTGTLRLDPRWPQFAASASDTDVESILAAPILLGTDRVGALILYSTKPFAFLEAEVRICAWFASAVAAVLNDLRTHDELTELAKHLQTALDSRGVIDQAKGIIMAHRHCGPDEAFAHLVGLSSASEVKVRDIARQLVEQTERDT